MRASPVVQPDVAQVSVEETHGLRRDPVDLLDLVALAARLDLGRLQAARVPAHLGDGKEG